MELQQEAQSASEPETVRALQKANRQRQEETTAELSAAFKEQQWQSAQSCVRKLTYWNRVAEVLAEKA